MLRLEVGSSSSVLYRLHPTQRPHNIPVALTSHQRSITSYNNQTKIQGSLGFLLVERSFMGLNGSWLFCLFILLFAFLVELDRFAVSSSWAAFSKWFSNFWGFLGVVPGKGRELSSLPEPSAANRLYRIPAQLKLDSSEQLWHNLPSMEIPILISSLNWF